MNKIYVLLLLLGLSIFCSCQKQQTDAERQAEIDRQVQQRLDAEHQSQEKEKLAQRESDLEAREKALSQKETAPAAAPVADETESVRTDRRDREPNDRDSGGSGSYDTFYTKLDSYGDWRETSDYGYVFQPRQAQQSRTWRPYTEGRWVYTDAGWTWISEEPFGWATYHYGRWTRLRNIGWVWIPGDEWAPAWVSWRKSDDYVGWAPLPPEAQFDRRTGIHNWADNYYDIGPDQYCFVSTGDFGEQRIEHTVVPAERNVTIINLTTNVTNITYSNTTVINQGPNFDELRTRTHRPIERLRLERDVNVNMNVGGPSSVVRGEVIAIPAPIIRRAQPARRPVRVKETIAHVDVERGWDANPDRQAVEKLRVKMRAEATPPPNAPSKTFVRPTQVRAEQTSLSAATTTPIVAASPAQTSTPPFRRRLTDTTPVPAVTSSATASPVVSATGAPAMTPFRRATPVPASTPIATITPVSTSTPRPVMTPRPLVTPASSPMPSVNNSPISAGGADVSEPQPGVRERKPPITPDASTTPFPGNRREFKKEEKQLRKEERRGNRPGPAAETPTPGQ